MYMSAILVKDTSCFGKCIRETLEEKHKMTLLKSKHLVYSSEAPEGKPNTTIPNDHIRFRDIVAAKPHTLGHSFYKPFFKRVRWDLPGV